MSACLFLHCCCLPPLEHTIPPCTQLSRLQREADRCREAVLRMSLLRPHITFTLFDRGRRAFTLRLLKVVLAGLLLQLPAVPAAVPGDAHPASQTSPNLP